MKRYPKALQRPLAGSMGQPEMRAHNFVCVHTMVGNLASTDEMFKRNGYSGTESHYGVGGAWARDAQAGLDGAVYEWVNPTYTADANLDGRWDVISIETADNAPAQAKDIAKWTAKQVVALVDLIHWLCSKEAHSACPTSWKCHAEGIPMKLVPDTKPGRRGIAWHAQGVEHSRGVGAVPGFLVTGGTRWSSAKGKECPGPQRIGQLKATVVPAVVAKAAPKPPPPAPKPPAPKPPEPDMTPAELLAFEVILTNQGQVDQMNSTKAPTRAPFKIGDTLPIRHFLLWGGPGMERLRALFLAEANANAEHRQDTAEGLARIEALLLSDNAPTGDPRGV